MYYIEYSSLVAYNNDKLLIMNMAQPKKRLYRTCLSAEFGTLIAANRCFLRVLSVMPPIFS